MSALRTARALARAQHLAVPARTFTASRALLKETEPVNNEPIPMKAKPQFPAPVDPFNPAPAKQKPAGEYSESTKNLVRGVAKLLGYNSKASTAIRETGRMMRGIVTAVEKERSFWYDGESLHGHGAASAQRVPAADVQSASCQQRTRHSSSCTSSTFWCS